MGLGSNIGTTKQNILLAVEKISAINNVNVIKLARGYITKAWGITDQNDFVNTVVKIETVLDPLSLLTEFQKI